MQFVKFLIIFSVFAVIVFCKSDDLLETEEDILELEKNSIDSEKLFKERPKLLSRGQRVRRFIGFKQPNKNYQACITPGNSTGYCKHIQHCVLSDFKNNFWRFIDYLCIIERSSLGVCCPEALTEKAGPSFSSNLPSDGEEPVIWDHVENRVDNMAADTNVEPIVTHTEDRGCGIATKSFPKISGGRPADPGEWPWMAALLPDQYSAAFCGGVLITDRHVLTAAHCTRKFRANELYVRLGEYDFSRFNETRSRDFRVLEIRNHLDFDPVTYENDISVLKLHAPTLFNTYIWPVCMPPLGEDWEGRQAVVTGWGTQFFGGPTSRILMEVTLPIWTKRECQDSFTHQIRDSVICAGAHEGGRDSCQGDSGGPLLVQLPNRRWVTVGIVSWGIRCGEANRPGIYTRVSSYVRWVIDNSNF